MDNENNAEVSFDVIELAHFAKFKKAREENENNGNNDNCGIVIVCNSQHSLNMVSFGDMDNTIVMQVAALESSIKKFFSGEERKACYKFCEKYFHDLNEKMNENCF